MLDRFHPPVEEYLETIFALEEEGIPVIQARLAERLGKAAPSVSERLDGDKAHVEAGRWEHVISDDVEAHLVVLLGNPTTCPHGNPIPGVEPVGPEQRRLADAQPGDRIRLERITESVEHDTASLTYLGDHGLTPGITALIQARAPDGTLTLVVGDAAIALGPAMTQRMFVAPA